jgi:hypothetical protein
MLISDMYNRDIGNDRFPMRVSKRPLRPGSTIYPASPAEAFAVGISSAKRESLGIFLVSVDGSALPPPSMPPAASSLCEAESAFLALLHLHMQCFKFRENVGSNIDFLTENLGKATDEKDRG